MMSASSSSSSSNGGNVAVLDQSREEEGEKNLLDMAVHHVERLELKEACTLLTELLQHEPQHTVAMDLLGQVYLDLGDFEHAFDWFKQSAETNPDDYSKWLFLGQLQSGQDSVDCYEQGVRVLLTQLEEFSMNPDSQKELQHTLASAYVSIAEAYTTDLCDEKNAEQRCVELLAEALKVSPGHEEALYANGNLCLIRGQVDEAKQYALQCHALCVADLEAIEQQQQPDESNNNNNNNNELTVVTPDEAQFAAVATKTNIAKLLMELDLFEEGLFVLEYVLGIDDSIAEIWYLTGVCYGQTGNVEDASIYLSKAVSMLEAVKEEDPNVDDQGILQAAQELLKQLQRSSSSSS